MAEIAQKYGNASWSTFSSFYLSELRHSRDPRTIYTLTHLLDLADLYFNHNRLTCTAPRARQHDDYIASQEELWMWKQRFPTLTDFGENFYHHHGLRFVCPDSVRRYVSTRDMMDVGSANGDSLLVIRNYTNKRVISYDLIPASAALSRKWENEQSTVLNIGLTHHVGSANVSESGDGTAGLHSAGTAVVPLSTVDAEVERLNLTLGFLKADIEGEEMNMLRGAVKTLREQRPVLALSLYHNVQLLEIPKFVVGLGGYKVRYYFACDRWFPFFEYTLLAYPDFLED
jgi:FkbM family methyltransferase